MFNFLYKTPIGHLQIIFSKIDSKIVSCIFIDYSNLENKSISKCGEKCNHIKEKSEEIRQEEDLEYKYLYNIFKNELDNYFINKKDFSKEFLEKYIDIKSLKATDFQKSIWSIICKVKIGETINYTQMAIKSDNLLAARAAGTACGKNPLALFIPCHRVLRKDGEVNYADRGYSWGPERKTFLLEMEGYIFSETKK